jgi:hypothetical protein
MASLRSPRSPRSGPPQAAPETDARRQRPRHPRRYGWPLALSLALILVTALVPRALADDGDLPTSSVPFQAEPFAEAPASPEGTAATDALTAQGSQATGTGDPEAGVEERQQPQPPVVIAQSPWQDRQQPGDQQTDDANVSKMPPLPEGPTAAAIGGGAPSGGGQRPSVAEVIGNLEATVDAVIDSMPAPGREPVTDADLADQLRLLGDALWQIEQLTPQTEGTGQQERLEGLKERARLTLDKLLDLPNPMIGVDFNQPRATPAQPPAPVAHPGPPASGSGPGEAQPVARLAGFPRNEPAVPGPAGFGGTKVDTTIPLSANMSPEMQVTLATGGVVTIGLALAAKWGLRLACLVCSLMPNILPKGFLGAGPTMS